ncbi:MAG: ferrous iron transport protein A [Bacteroidetes bacterium]|nr:ferrous iron transport protein A [Rhodothermia bacterium]MCX7906691.1 ferrous iron transport protein A [Bacteroidota bacterium]MDW8285100.1 FeoA family protein [Bacteroidota bacterium]
MVPLAECIVGSQVQVIRIADDRYGTRLRELGLAEGERMAVLRGPDPILVRVRDARLAIGRRLAHAVWVMPLQ